MDFDFDDLITDIQIHPKRQNLLAVGIGETICYIQHDTKKDKFYETRSIGINGYARGFRFSPQGDSLMAILDGGEMRVFSEELNLKRRYKFKDDVNAIGQPFVDANDGTLGLDVLVGFDSGKICGYDTRDRSKKPAITLESHTNSVNSIKCGDWWGCTSIADDNFIVLNDFRNKRTTKSDYGPLNGMSRDLCICPFSKKTIVCTYENVYVFNSYDFDDGPLLKSGPAYAGKMPNSALSLSTHEKRDLFGISYIDSPYITILDTDNHIWLRRYATRHIGIDLFAFPERRTHGYVYFSGNDTYFCVRKLDDIREDCDQVLFTKAGDEGISPKKREMKEGTGLFDESEGEEDGDDVDDDGAYIEERSHKTMRQMNVLPELDSENDDILDALDTLIDNESDISEKMDEEPAPPVHSGIKRKASEGVYETLAKRRKKGYESEEDSDDEDFVPQIEAFSSLADAIASKNRSWSEAPLGDNMGNFLLDEDFEPGKPVTTDVDWVEELSGKQRKDPGEADSSEDDAFKTANDWETKLDWARQMLKVNRVEYLDDADSSDSGEDEDYEDCESSESADSDNQMKMTKSKNPEVFDECFSAEDDDDSIMDPVAEDPVDDMDAWIAKYRPNNE